MNCCETVCSLDPFCCNDYWDISCARKAIDNCPNICDCDTFGDFDANVVVNLRDVAVFFECVTGPDNGPVTPGCECADYDADDAADLDDLAPVVVLFAP